uniref:Uncharacterized protein n=1 Tax=Aegilops tauschii subsp. strangulata TaxID=200361 RepID=A0A453JUX7_AEGTS
MRLHRATYLFVLKLLDTQFDKSLTHFSIRKSSRCSCFENIRMMFAYDDVKGFITNIHANTLNTEHIYSNFINKFLIFLQHYMFVLYAVHFHVMSCLSLHYIYM